MAEIPVRCFLVAAYLLRGTGTETRTLLMKRTGGSLDGIWCQVSGSIEEGETAWQAALREIREETGITPTRFYTTDLCEQFYEPDRDSLTVAPVFVGTVPDDVAVTLNEEHGDYAWCTLDESLEKLQFPGQRRIVTEIWREFVEREPTSWLEIET